ncbi:alpha/beta hydrolase [Rhodococcus pyridinivorans]|uniref:alpha/beta hydrolase n=1 Tax=Rhodococcus TaxID=1827 RepID=UPI001C77B03B|nr:MULTISPECIES: alpha/beta-hydrolase family protein [Rhodococcus]QXF81379.1 hypothetical protein HBA53_10220 [Rhodococcus pyridinivorans]
MLFACLSFTPSLLPRGGILQGMICGITAAIGYGLGVLLAFVWRAFADRPPRSPKAASWWIFGVCGAVLFAVFFGLGQYWQHEIRTLMRVSEYNLALAVLSPLVAVVMFAVLLAIGRGIRALYHWAARTLDRWIGQRAANVVGWVLVAGLVYAIVSGVLLAGFIDAANAAFSARDTRTEEGVQQPTTALRSGGPDSFVPWDSLGWQGRIFVGQGPTTEQLGEFTEGPALEPIRIYAGLASADDTEDRASLAVEDLTRAGGFERSNLVVVTTTGSGWVDPALVDSVEYLTGGDVATVAIQYSYLPSWISYLVDQSKAREAGRDLFDAVYDVWSKLPQDARPRLLVAGESLGSFGGETAFSGEYDLRNRTSGTVFAGPPNFNVLFREFSDRREAGSPEIEPVFRDGRTVRFTNDPQAEIPPTDEPWEGSRVLYLMHPSDPIVWWSPHLITSEPDWIGEAPGRDVLEDMVWIPFVTFWQVTADLPFSTGVPAGHGHRYSTEYVDAWALVLQSPEITPDDIDEVKFIVGAEE